MKILILDHPLGTLLDPLHYAFSPTLFQTPKTQFVEAYTFAMFKVLGTWVLFLEMWGNLVTQTMTIYFDLILALANSIGYLGVLILVPLQSPLTYGS